MTALAQAPVPLIAALTVLSLALLSLIAMAVFAPTDAPARRLCAILAIIRRQRFVKKDTQTELETNRQIADTLADLIIGGTLASIEITKADSTDAAARGDKDRGTAV